MNERTLVAELEIHGRRLVCRFRGVLILGQRNFRRGCVLIRELVVWSGD